MSASIAGAWSRYLEAKKRRVDGEIYSTLSAVQARLLPRLTELLASLDEWSTALPDEDLDVCRRFTERLEADVDDVLARPEWTTFEELDVSRLSNPDVLVLRRGMTALGRQLDRLTTYGVGPWLGECQRKDSFTAKERQALEQAFRRGSNVEDVAFAE